MKNPVSPVLLALLLAPLSTACVGTTGGGLVDFDAVASGPADAAGAPFTDHAYTFVSPYSGWTITLTTATLQIGAVYLDATPCSGGSAILPCSNENAATVAQVNGGVSGAFGVQTSGVLLDALSPDAQPFLSGGSGIIQQARSAEVWLSSGAEGMAIDDANDVSTIAQVAGSATRGEQTFPFIGTVTISSNRLLPVSNPALPGENPICEQRIVRPICLAKSPAVEPEPGSALHVGVDPKGWFNNVDFSKLDTTVAPPYPIPDSNDDRNGRNLLQGIESSSGVYSFTFQSP